MAFHSIVLIKQVPDTTAVSKKAMKPDGTLNRSALPAVFNPEDLVALELALQVRERSGGSVTAMTMGPPPAAEVLRESLYRGADRAVLLTDRAFAASDTLATSAVLSRAVRHIGSFDLIFCGRQAIDGNTAQVGPQVAEKLGINQITCVERIESIDNSAITAWRVVENGHEMVRSALPVLLTVIASAAAPRPPSVKKIMRYKKTRAAAEMSSAGVREPCGGSSRAIEELSIADLGMDPALCGLAGSPTRVKKIESVVLTGKEMKAVPPTDEGIRTLLQELIDDYTFD